MERKDFLRGMGAALVAVATVDVRTLTAAVEQRHATAVALAALPTALRPVGVAARGVPPVVLRRHLARVTFWSGHRPPCMELGPLHFEPQRAAVVCGVGLYDERGHLLIDPPALGTVHLVPGDRLIVRYTVSGPGTPWLLG